MKGNDIDYFEYGKRICMEMGTSIQFKMPGVGFSLQSGILHANRVGDLDPYIIVYLLKSGMPLDELTEGLVENGGIKGISGVSNDLRDSKRKRAAAGREDEVPLAGKVNIVAGLALPPMIKLAVVLLQQGVLQV